MIGRVIHALLKADPAVNALVGGRISPSFAAQGRAYPYIVYQRIGTARVRSSEGPSLLAHARVQITIYDGRDGAEVQASVEAIADAVRRALDGFPRTPPATVAGVVCRGIELEDERDQPVAPGGGTDKPVAGVSQDYMCWWDELPVTHT